MQLLKNPIIENAAHLETGNTQVQPFIVKSLSARVLDGLVWLYLVGALLALLPLIGVGSWRTALIRLGLVCGSVGVYFIISRFFHSTARLTWLVLAIVGGAVGAALVGTAQVNTSSLRLSGFNYQIYAALAPIRKLLPASFPHVHQNVLGGLLATFLPPGLALLVWGQLWWQRLYGGIAGVIVVTMLVVTSSRGAMIGLGAGLMGLVWFGLAKYPRLRLIVFGLLTLLAVPTLLYLLADVLPQVDNGTSRLQLWANTVRLIGDYPFTGAGLGQFELQSGIHGIADKHAHNLFLQSWAEFGLSGFIAILLLLFVVACILWYYRRLDGIAVAQKPLMIGAVCGLLAMFGDGLVEYGTWGGKFAPAFLIFPAVLAGCQLPLPSLCFIHISVRKWVWLPVSALLAFLLVPLLLINVGSIVSSPALFEVAATLAPWNAAPPRSLGRLALQQGDTTAAQTYYTTALARDDGDWKILMVMADFAEKQGNHAKAVAYWRKAATATYFAQQANQNLQLGQPQIAEKNLKLALELDPNNLEATQQLVEIYVNTGRQADAQVLLQTILARRPTAALFEQAAKYATTNQQRTDLLQQAIKADPQRSGYYWELGNVYFELQQFDQAEQLYKQAKILQPEDRRPILGLGQLYLSKQQPQASILELETFLNKGFFVESPDPEYILLAQAYIAVANYDAAITAAKKAIQYNPTNPNAYLVLGDGWRGKGDIIQARAAYNQVLQLDTHNGAALKGLDLLIGR